MVPIATKLPRSACAPPSPGTQSSHESARGKAGRSRSWWTYRLPSPASSSCREEVKIRVIRERRRVRETKVERDRMAD
jgi:hypothetical protein